MNAQERAEQLQRETGRPHRAKLIRSNNLYWTDEWWEIQERTEALLFQRWRLVETLEIDA